MTGYAPSAFYTGKGTREMSYTAHHTCRFIFIAWIGAVKTAASRHPAVWCFSFEPLSCAVSVMFRNCEFHRIHIFRLWSAENYTKYVGFFAK